MQNSIQQLQNIIHNYTSRLNNLNEQDWADKPNPAKWSRKEVLGHLVDSAQNNIRRFIVAQSDYDPKIVYAQDVWVAASGYQNYLIQDLVSLWVSLNKHICIILKNVPQTAEDRLCDVGELRSIKWLAEDYNKHLLHHLHQLLDMEPVAYP